LIETEDKPISIVLDNTSATVSMMLKMYDEDFSSLTGMAKDFVRNMIFPKISNLVPSSTRQGAEAFLRAIRRPRDVFEYEKSDLGSLSEIWQDYLDGKITLTDAARQSTTIVSTNVQVVDRSATTKVADVIPDVLDNERMLEQGTREDVQEALPAITRLEVTSAAKLLIIDDNEEPLKGYRCFLALTDRVRENRGEFFLQPHRTEIVWGGQKALYIFQHHSGEFGLYYELLGNEILSDTPGGKAFFTCTIVLRNQIYIPIPDEIRGRFIPGEVERKRFEIRCELLYPETTTSGVNTAKK
jgi:molecular chaperone HtpG